MSPVRLYHIFPHYLINVMMSEKIVFKYEMFFGFLYNFFFSETFLILRGNERDMTKTCIGLLVNYCHYCQILNKLAFSRQIFEKY